MTFNQKGTILTWSLFGAIILFIFFAFPLPVHRVNKACCSAEICTKEHHHEKDASPPLTNLELQIWYQNLNELFYLGQLPKVVEIRWGDLSAQKAMGLTEHVANGNFIITIDRAWNPTASEAEMTLAHETCHVKTWGTPELPHGPKFQNCMVNLATHGAFEGIW